MDSGGTALSDNGVRSDKAAIMRVVRLSSQYDR